MYGIKRTNDLIRIYERSYREDMKCIQVGTLKGEKWDKMHEQSRRVYSPDGVAPTIHTMGGAVKR